MRRVALGGLVFCCVAAFSTAAYAQAVSGSDEVTSVPALGPVQAPNLRLSVEEFTFTPKRNPALRLYLQAPKVRSANTEVVVAMHGVTRNARAVFDAWSGLLAEHDVVLVVPHFSSEAYRGAARYNLGHMLEGRQVRDPHLWSFGVVEEIFEAVNSRLQMNALHYSLFGHSAGAQFVHRFVQFMPQIRAKRAISANAGWYTMPDVGDPFPYSQAGAPQLLSACARLARPMTVMLGGDDTDPAHHQLNITELPARQGAHRVERGLAFMQRAQALAKREGCPLAWQLVRIPGVAHEFDKMAAAAILHWRLLKLPPESR